MELTEEADDEVTLVVERALAHVLNTLFPLPAPPPPPTDMLVPSIAGKPFFPFRLVPVTVAVVMLLDPAEKLADVASVVLITLQIQ